MYNITQLFVLDCTFYIVYYCFYSMDKLSSFSEEKFGQDVKLTTEHHKVPRLRMNGVLPPIQLSVFMVLTVTNVPSPYVTLSLLTYTIIIIGIQPLGRFGQRPELSQSTGIVLVRCILGKFLGVVCHCFPPRLDVPTFPLQKKNKRERQYSIWLRLR